MSCHQTFLFAPVIWPVYCSSLFHLNQKRRRQLMFRCADHIGMYGEVMGAYGGVGGAYGEEDMMVEGTDFVLL